MPHGDHLSNILANNPENKKITKNKQCYFLPNTSAINDFLCQICLECLQELSYFNFFITGKRLT